jgi:hypothetical protein
MKDVALRNTIMFKSNRLTSTKLHPRHKAICEPVGISSNKHAPTCPDVNYNNKQEEKKCYQEIATDAPK